jgi:hypothetical protein
MPTTLNCPAVPRANWFCARPVPGKCRGVLQEPRRRRRPPGATAGSTRATPSGVMPRAISFRRSHQGRDPPARREHFLVRGRGRSAVHPAVLEAAAWRCRASEGEDEVMAGRHGQCRSQHRPPGAVAVPRAAHGALHAATVHPGHRGEMPKTPTAKIEKHRLKAPASRRKPGTAKLTASTVRATIHHRPTPTNTDRSLHEPIR